MKIYLICPVRLSTPETAGVGKEYVQLAESEGHSVFYPLRNVEQAEWPIWDIVDAEIEAIRTCDEVHIIWDATSRGSHFDLGAAMALGKPIKLIHSFLPDGPEKSYEKVIRKRGL